jgi:hypothetical protein
MEKCLIYGKLNRPFVDDYIILLDDKLEEYDPAIVLIDSCIKLKS